MLDLITKRFTDPLGQLRRKTRMIMAGVLPDNANKSEFELWRILDEYFPYTYKYVGDFKINIGRRFPDFINISGKKEIIELFGSFWHIQDEVRQTITHYEKYGYSCIVIWEEELSNPNIVVNHIRNGNIYIPCYKGSTIFDWVVPIRSKENQPKLDMESMIIVNVTLMLPRSLIIQTKEKHNPHKPSSYVKLSQATKKINIRIRRLNRVVGRN